MPGHILIIEDEEKIARFVELELVHEGYSVDKRTDGRSGLDAALSGVYDCVLLDILLPELNGLEVLRRIRKSSSVPVIMLTARDAVMDKVSGLDMGADDYVTKPFAIEELLARIRLVIRKSENAVSHESELVFGHLRMSEAAHTVTYDGEPVELTGKEFALLRELLKNKNIVLSRDSLLERVWGYDYLGETNVVDVYVRYLRSKIDDVHGIKMIRTVRGVGYGIME